MCALRAPHNINEQKVMVFALTFIPLAALFAHIMEFMLDLLLLNCIERATKPSKR